MSAETSTLAIDTPTSSWNSKNVRPASQLNKLATDATEAARLAFQGESKLLDVGEVDGKSFVGIASAGFDSDANRIANEARLIRGNLVYAYAALKALAGWKPAHFEIVVDGVRHESTGYTVAVANSKAYGGGMFLAPQAELDDGKLDVIVSGETTKRHFLRSLPKVFKGAHLDEPSVTCFKGEVIEVSADRPFVMYADGDPLSELPATVRVSPRSLRVIVPPA